MTRVRIPIGALNKMNKQNFKKKFTEFHDKNYKLLLLIPLILIIASFIYMGFFYSQHHDFINKDISLTGGTSVTINDKNLNLNDLKNAVSNKLDDVNVRQVSDLITQSQVAVILETKSDATQTRQVLENYLGYTLNEKNSSFEFTGSTLGAEFYSQLLLSIIFAFTFMGLVIFFIFSKNTKLKILMTFLSVITPILFFFTHTISVNEAFIFSGIIFLISIILYTKDSIPSVAVIASAFADIFMTLIVVNLLGIKVSSAGIIAFLMLIGYSVDTDILLTTRAIKRDVGTLNRRMFESFKTGITMTLTAITAVLTALIIIGSFSSVLSQIFTIIAIGLGFDILNTWLTNVSIIKWYLLRKKHEN
jgi:preprotein translocase subunit SecF